MQYLKVYNTRRNKLILDKETVSICTCNNLFITVDKGRQNFVVVLHLDTIIGNLPSTFASK
uniref:Uncharacterized protein n=1 Tax=Setaria italica TaxID=4555 RepID=K3ZBN6_SETIT